MWRSLTQPLRVAALFAGYLVLYIARRGAQALVARGTLISQTLRAKRDGSIATGVHLGDAISRAPWPATQAVPLTQVLAESKLLVRRVRARSGLRSATNADINV